MESSANATQPKVLVVEHRTSITQPLLDAVSERARRGPCTFALLVPNTTHGLHKVVDPNDQGAGEARGMLDRALPALSAAAGVQVEGLVGDPDPIAAIEDALNLHGFDEIVISAPSPRLARWLKLDLASKVSGMGIPVTTVGPSHEAHVVAAA
jgi:hypothetical protein